MIDEKKILVTGGTGMIGYALKWGYTYGDSIPNSAYVSSEDFDLRDKSATEDMFSEHKPEYVIHLAAKVGGVKSNSEYLGDFYHDNITINTNVLECARQHGVKKLVSLLSTCIYPDKIDYPLLEENIHNGPPHQSNYAYAYAKRMLDIQSRAYRDQYGSNFITVVLNNMFGENDNFDLENSHVIPAMIRKIYEAKVGGDSVVLWGDGSNLREFTYSGDMAEILLFALKEYEGIAPINVGNAGEISIKEVSGLIANNLDFDGEIIWDTSKPSGQHRKPSDNSRLLRLGWDINRYTPLEKALKKTCDWFIMNYPNVRGVK